MLKYISMTFVSHQKLSSLIRRHRRIALGALILLAVLSAFWFFRAKGKTKPKGPTVIQVVSTTVKQSDVAVRLVANGTVSALQSVDVKPQVSATIKVVHIREGQFVRKGELLFTLDARTEEANLNKAEALVLKDKADLANAERNFERQRLLFKQEYISQAEFDTAQNQVDGLKSQLAIDQASVRVNQVARSFNEIYAPISGRTGAISVYPGSLVQPGGNATSLGAVLVSITQIAPININFTLPERELATLLQAYAKGAVPVSAELDAPGSSPLKGRLVFVDNAVDVSSGTIRLKAEFPNQDHQLWPGMFVTVKLTPRTLSGALTVPVQAVQTGPEKKFLYVIDVENKVSAQTITLRLIQDGIAVIEGVPAGARVVVEGAQNLRPGMEVK
jgi:RND family efflux transporter MFP subunit